MKLRIFTVDAFTQEPFSGNPAAVVPLEEGLPRDLMQKIAFELNLSETAFVRAPPGSSSPWENGKTFDLKWFTPTHEVALCGHATLATAHTLYNILGNKSPELEFESLSGILKAKKVDEGIALDFPSQPPKPLTDAQQQKYSELIRVASGGKKVNEVALSAEAGYILIRLDDSYTRAEFESIQTTKEEVLKHHDGSDFLGIILTLQGDLHRNQDKSRGLGDYNFVYRFFAPWLGIHEDPVTGSANTVSGPYWTYQTGLKQLKCRQCSKRGGELTIRVRDDRRVDIVGKTVTVIEGTIKI